MDMGKFCKSEQFTGNELSPGRLSLGSYFKSIIRGSLATVPGLWHVDGQEGYESDGLKKAGMFSIMHAHQWFKKIPYNNTTV